MSSKSVPGDGTHASGTKGGSLEWLPVSDADEKPSPHLTLRDLARMAWTGIRSIRRAGS